MNPGSSMRSSLFFAAAIGLIAACTPAAIRNNQTAETRIPSDLAGAALPILPVTEDYITVEFGIDGEDGFRFLLDTGATPTAVFTSPRIDGLGLETGGRRLGVTGAGDGEGVQSSFSREIDLSIGPAEIVGMTPLVIPHEPLPFFHDRETVYFDGVIGYDLFKRFAVEVDRRAGLVRLHPPGADIPGLSPRAVRVPLQIRGGDAFLIVQIQVENDGPLVDAHMHLDTGMNKVASLIPGRHPSFASAPDADISTGVGVSGTLDITEDRVASLSLGGLALADAPVAYVGSPDPYNGRHGRLGVAALNRFRYVIDYEAETLILDPRPGTFEPFDDPPRAGLGLAAFGEGLDRFVVIGVQGGGGAHAAGIEPGDVVVSIDGVPAAEIARSGLAGAVTGKAVGDTIEVCLAPASAQDCRAVLLS